MTLALPMLAESYGVYIFPVIGSMLLFYGVYQVITDSKTSDDKKLQERLRGEKRREEKVAATILRRGALGEDIPLRDSLGLPEQGVASDCEKPDVPANRRSPDPPACGAEYPR